MRKVSSSCLSTTWLSQILSKRVRGLLMSFPSFRGVSRASTIAILLACGTPGGRRFRCRLRRRIAGALGDPRGLAGQAAEVIELGAPHLAAAHDLDRREARRVEREDALDTLAIGDLAQSEIRVDSRILAPDADALEGLDALALALDNLDADAHRIAGAEIGDRAALDQFLDLLLLERLKNIHRNSPTQCRLLNAVAWLPHQRGRPFAAA